MLAKLTADDSTRTALALANIHACRGGADVIGPLHLLLAVLRIADGVADEGAAAMGLAPVSAKVVDEVSRETRRILGLTEDGITTLRRRVRRHVEAAGSGSPVRRLDLAPSARVAVEAAALLASSGGATSLRAVHLATSLLQNPPEDVAAVLAGQEPPRVAPPLKSLSVVDLGVPARDLTALARDGRLATIVGRRAETKALARHLQRTTKRNALLIGDAGVGKTAIVEALAQRLAAPDAPEFLGSIRIIQVEVRDLVSGASVRGELEQRLQRLVEAVSSDPRIVLFLDEIHLVVGAGAAPGALDVANILKPALAREDFRCIGATTVDEFERHIKSDAAFLRRFQVVRVAEPSLPDAIEMCRSWARRIEERQEVVVEDDAVVAAVELSASLLRGRALPDKAIDLLENAATAAKVTTLTFRSASPTKELPRIGRRHIETVLRDDHGVSPLLLDPLDRARVIEVLGGALPGQARAVAEIAEAVTSRARANRAGPRPRAVLLLAGAAGGTASAPQLINQALFGDPSSFVAFNLAEFRDRHELSRLIGAPPGFIGHERPGRLFHFAERHPRGVVLLANVDDADPAVRDFFFEVFGTGVAADARGRPVDFQQYVFVLTCRSAAGAAHLPIGFLAAGKPAAVDAGPGPAWATVLGREFMTRVDRVIVFDPPAGSGDPAAQGPS